MNIGRAAYDATRNAVSIRMAEIVAFSASTNGTVDPDWEELVVAFSLIAMDEITFAIHRNAILRGKEIGNDMKEAIGEIRKRHLKGLLSMSQRLVEIHYDREIAFNLRDTA